MTAIEWFENGAGLWWCSHDGAERLRAAIETSGRWSACVMPPAAPLLERLSIVSNCRIYCRLAGKKPGPTDIVTALRTVEIPDDLSTRPAWHLDDRHRALTWLAIARLIAAPMLMVLDPLPTFPAKGRAQFGRILKESLAHHRHILVVTDYSEQALSLGALHLPLITDCAS